MGNPDGGVSLIGHGVTYCGSYNTSDIFLFQIVVADHLLAAHHLKIFHAKYFGVEGA